MTMKTNFSLTIVAAALVALAGCSTVGSRVGSDGHAIGAPVFPDTEKAMAPEGRFPDLDKLRQVRPGITKNELYALLDAPHFREGFVGVDRWDYIFHFPTGNGTEFETCRFQILFDQGMRAQSFLWLPQSCGDRLKAASPAVMPAPMAAPVSMPAPAPAPTIAAPAAKAPSVPRRLQVSMGDIQFAFGKGSLQGAQPHGVKALDEIARKLKAMGTIERIEVVGHADRIGTAAFNQRLSETRARTVSRSLAEHGVAPALVTTRGAGQSAPLVECQDTARVALHRCLAPNRRVEILVWTTQAEAR
ncbi:MAG TPA: OmpA family protein [Burkholderiaceae bacterium]